MKMLLLVAVDVVLLVAIAILVVASPASGGSGEQAVSPPVRECGFGFFDSPNDMVQKCTPANYSVQPGDTFSRIAEILKGRKSDWPELCTVKTYGKITVLTPATEENDQDLQPRATVTLCAPNSRPADQRMTNDRHDPQSTDARGSLHF